MQFDEKDICSQLSRLCSLGVGEWYIHRFEHTMKARGKYLLSLLCAIYLFLFCQSLSWTCHPPCRVDWLARKSMDPQGMDYKYMPTCLPFFLPFFLPSSFLPFFLLPFFHLSSLSVCPFFFP